MPTKVVFFYTQCFDRPLTTLTNILLFLLFYEEVKRNWAVAQFENELNELNT